MTHWGLFWCAEALYVAVVLSIARGLARGEGLPRFCWRSWLLGVVAGLLSVSAWGGRP